MYGGAVELANMFLESTFQPDLLVVSDMLDLACFLALTRSKVKDTPVVLYFHENQITYPWSPDDPDLKLQRDNQYGFINYTSALAADRVCFNSKYHFDSFLKALPNFLGQFPDYKGLDNVETIRKKSTVLHLGLDLEQFKPESSIPKSELPVILWNHRWEYDKNPEQFFKVLFQLKAENIPFQLILLGTVYARQPKIFKEAQEKLSAEMIHSGYTEDFETYKQLLHQADILLVTSQQDFFGGSIVEAIYCNCHPILPDRLAYPEHIPLNQQYLHLYNSEEELYQKLKTALLNFQHIRAHARYSYFVEAYDWRTLALEYDYVFDSLIF